MERRLLIIGGSAGFRERLLPFLETRYKVKCSDHGAEALEMLGACRPAVVLLGAKLPDMNGLDILTAIRRDFPKTKTILFSGSENMAVTIQAAKHGAFDCVLEDVEPGRLDQKIQEALRLQTLTEKIKPVPQPAATDWEGQDIIGRTPAMREIYKFIGRISNTNATVGIRGETGTGKELVARVIHQNSANRHEPFITVDCSTIVETLSESTLYGHEKGSFTGAVDTRPGQFEIAGEGTIFLDEIAEIPLALQAKLLRFLQEKEYQPVGSRRPRKSNARIIVATNRDLYRSISEGKFRKD
ncbi:MAG: sigma 54-interacting transcriptional regulator, partial [Thermodesulfobacteriota bacterium]